MKRVIQKIGSRKWYGDDFINIQNEALAATEAHFKDYGAHVLTGCVVSGTDISAGVVLIDGKACRYQGETAVTFPRYLVKQETEVDNENYETGGSKPTYLEVYAVGQSTVPASGEYVTIQSGGGVRRLMDVIRDNHDHPASAITSGTLDVARIPNLSAAKITSGILAVARIPDLDAGKIITGVLAVARIPDLDAGKITTGILGVARIPDLAAGKITTGVLAVARIPSLATSKITSGTFADARISSSSVIQHLVNYVDKSKNEDIGGVKSFLNVIKISKTDGEISHSLNSSRILIAGGSSASTANGAYIDIQGNNYGGTGSGGDISFQVTSGKSFRFITGHVGINNLNPINRLDIGATNNDEALFRLSHPSAPDTAGLDFKFIDSNGAIAIRTQFSSNFTNSIILKRSNAYVGILNSNPQYHLDVTGDIRASGNVFSNSDKRLKTRITSIDRALPKALNINACYYNWKDEKHGKGRQFGLIAQEVESVLPEVVNTDKNGSKVLDYAKLSALLFSALKELNTKVESLKN